jgi:nicotinamidase-related amidase
MKLEPNASLIVVDVQAGLEESAYWGRRNNATADTNIAALISHWKTNHQPIVIVRHDSVERNSPLRPGEPGNSLKDYVAATNADLLITKSVNSAFYGEPDLHEWLARHQIRQIVIAGIQTNMCCESTARMGADLGYDVVFVADATYTFDLAGPDGSFVTADDLVSTTVTNLSGGGFARIVPTASLVTS